MDTAPSPLPTAPQAAGPRLLILLFGNRMQPGLLLAMQLQPAVIGGICSADTFENKVKTAGPALARVVRGGVKLVDLLPGPPYRVRPNLELLDHALADARTRYGRNLQPCIGIAGAPVPMTIAGYEMARLWGCPCYYVNTAGGEIIDLTAPDEPDALDQRMAISTHVRNAGDMDVMTSQQNMPHYVTGYAARKEAATKLGQAPAGQAGAVMRWLREKKNAPDAGTRPGQHSKVWEAGLGEEHWRLLEMLRTQGILNELARVGPGPTVRWCVPASGEDKFLEGAWLELYMMESGLAARIDGKADVFELCWQNLLIRSASEEDPALLGLADGESGATRPNRLREIDFVGIRNGLPLIASCKAMGNPWDKMHLDEINAVARLLGDGYCLRLFVTDQPRASGSEDFEKQASLLKVVVVAAEELPRLPGVLTREMLHPTYPCM